MPRTRSGLLTAVLLALVTTPVSAAASIEAAVVRVASAPSIEAAVVRVVDGDTIQVRVNGRLEKVRYIGINAPELRHPQKGREPGGPEAAALNRTLVGAGTVRLETDVRTRDRNGRLLAYVWVRNTMVNAELVQRGYAQVMTVPPNVRYQALFVKLERDARDAGRGLWRVTRARVTPAPAALGPATLPR